MANIHTRSRQGADALWRSRGRWSDKSCHCRLLLHLRIEHFQIARVDAVSRLSSGMRAGNVLGAWPSVLDKHFLQIERTAERRQDFCRQSLKSPAIISWAHRVHMPAHIFKNGLILLVAVGLAQIAMRTQTHQRKRPAFRDGFRNAARRAA